MPAGRPPYSTLRTPKNAEIICGLMAEGLSLRKIAPKVGISNKARILEWVAEDAEFADRYARAKALQAEHFAEELREISDAKDGDIAEDGSINHENIARSRLRVDTRKWLMSKYLPKVYGERVGVDRAVEQTINVHITHHVAADALLAAFNAATRPMIAATPADAGDGEVE